MKFDELSIQEKAKLFKTLAHGGYLNGIPAGQIMSTIKDSYENLYLFGGKKRRRQQEEEQQRINDEAPEYYSSIEPAVITASNGHTNSENYNLMQGYINGSVPVMQGMDNAGKFIYNIVDTALSYYPPTAGMMWYSHMAADALNGDYGKAATDFVVGKAIGKGLGLIGKGAGKLAGKVAENSPKVQNFLNTLSEDIGNLTYDRDKINIKKDIVKPTVNKLADIAESNKFSIFNKKFPFAQTLLNVRFPQKQRDLVALNADLYNQAARARIGLPQNFASPETYKINYSVPTIREQILNTAGRTDSSVGKITAGAINKGTDDVMFYLEGLLPNRKHPDWAPVNIAAHETRHSVQRGFDGRDLPTKKTKLYWSEGMPLSSEGYQYHLPVENQMQLFDLTRTVPDDWSSTDKFLYEFTHKQNPKLKEAGTLLYNSIPGGKENDWFRSLNEFDSELANFRQYFGTNKTWTELSPELKDKMSKAMSKRFGISEDIVDRIATTLSENGYAYGGNLYGEGDAEGGNLFAHEGDTPPWTKYVESYTPKDAGRHLNEENINYLKQFHDYNDYKARAKFTSKESQKSWEPLAVYYFNQSGAANIDAFYAMTEAVKDYMDKEKAIYQKAQAYLPSGGTTWRLHSIDENGKPTNKHGMKMDTALLDYIYDEAVRGGVDPKTALKIAVNESNLGNAKREFTGDNAFNLMSYWAAIHGSIYPNSQMSEKYNELLKKYNKNSLSAEDIQEMRNVAARYKYSTSRLTPYTGDNVIADAVNFYNKGYYPGSEPSANNPEAHARWEKKNADYAALLDSRWNELMNDEKFVDWYKNRNPDDEIFKEAEKIAARPKITSLEKLNSIVSKAYIGNTDNKSLKSR